MSAGRRKRPNGLEVQLHDVRKRLRVLRASGSAPPPLRNIPRRLPPISSPQQQRGRSQQASAQRPAPQNAAGAAVAGLRGRRRVSPPTTLDASLVSPSARGASSTKAAPTSTAAAAPAKEEEKKGAAKEHNFPFTQDKFEQLKAVFQELDTDGGGDLRLNEVNRIPELLGWRDLAIDRRMFRAMDKDRSGTVSFMEMLRCLYPTTKPTVLQLAATKWGEPDNIRKARRDRRRPEAQPKDVEEFSTDDLAREHLDDIREIFRLYAVGIPQNPEKYGLDGPYELGITRTSLGRHKGHYGVHVTAIADDILDLTFDEFREKRPQKLRLPGTDVELQEEDFYISEDRFAEIMARFYLENRSHKESQIGPLCFQDKQHPTVPYNLPRDPPVAPR